MEHYVTQRKAHSKIILVCVAMWISGVALVDARLDEYVLLPALLAVSPAVASFALSVKATLTVAVAAVLVALVLGVADHDFMSPQHVVDVCTVAAVGGLSVMTSRFRDRAEVAAAKAESLASIDPLTGLLNRRGLDDRVQALSDLRERPELWVLMLDLDYFKAINDIHGHVVGDEVLSAVSSRAQAALRKGDLLARFGGEEFLIVLVATCGEDTFAIAERIRGSITSEPVRTSDGLVNISASGGLSLVAQSEVGIAKAIERADVALYSSKVAGRGRVTLRNSDFSAGA